MKGTLETKRMMLLDRIERREPAPARDLSLMDWVRITASLLRRGWVRGSLDAPTFRGRVALIAWKARGSKAARR